MSCDQSQLLSAYLDGELPPAQAARVEEHVASCPACAAEAEEMRALRRLMIMARRSNLGQPSEETMDRLREHVQQLVETTEYGLLRIARIFSGLAATVLIAGLWLLHQAAPPAQPSVRLSAPQFSANEMPTLDEITGANPSENAESTREAVLEKLTGVGDPALSSNRPAGEDESP